MIIINLWLQQYFTFFNSYFKVDEKPQVTPDTSDTGFEEAMDISDGNKQYVMGNIVNIEHKITVSSNYLKGAMSGYFELFFATYKISLQDEGNHK